MRWHAVVCECLKFDEQEFVSVKLSVEGYLSLTRTKTSMPTAIDIRTDTYMHTRPK